MQNKIKSLSYLTGDQLAEQERQIAAAYFNTSFYGPLWSYLAYWWSYYERDNNINDNYLSCSTAFQYLNNALKHAVSQDLKAQIVYDIYSIKKYLADYDCESSWNEDCKESEKIVEEAKEEIKSYSNSIFKKYQSYCPDF